MASFNDTLKQALCELQDSYKEYIEREFEGQVDVEELRLGDKICLASTADRSARYSIHSFLDLKDFYVETVVEDYENVGNTLTISKAVFNGEDVVKRLLQASDFVGGVTFDELIFIPDEVSKTLDGFLG